MRASSAFVSACCWIVITCSLAGCNRSQELEISDTTSASSNTTNGGSAGALGAASGPNQKVKGVIGVSVLTLDNPFFKVIADNITAEAARFGYETKIVSGDKDVAKQTDQVKDFIVEGCAAIVLCPCDSKSIGPAIRQANDAGIPVFTTDIASQAPNARVECHIATDNLGGGREAGQAMIRALGETGGKVLIIHFAQAESCQMRVQGFREVIDRHNRDRTDGRIEIVAELEGGGAKDEGYRAAEDAAQGHPDLVGIFAINDPSAIGAYNALEKAGKADQIKIIGFDGQPEGKQAIKDGKIFADPIQFPDRMGVETVRAIMKYFKGEPLEPELLIPTELYDRQTANADPNLK